MFHHQAEVCVEGKPNKFYIGLTEGSFRIRWQKHKSDFNLVHNRNASSLATYMWKLKDEGINAANISINWSIVEKSRPYKPSDKFCALCATEKRHILKNEILKGNNSLNKRSEFVNKCRHKNKFLLSGLKSQRIDLLAHTEVGINHTEHPKAASIIIENSRNAKHKPKRDFFQTQQHT